MQVFVPWAAIEAYRNPSDSLSFYFGPFAYDHLSNEEIQEAVSSGAAQLVNLSQPWEGLIKSKQDHAARIGALVLVAQQTELEPVAMEISQYNRNLNLVVDGHHRIRALSFLQRPGFWAELGGEEDLIQEFVSVCRRKSS